MLIINKKKRKCAVCHNSIEYYVPLDESYMKQKQKYGSKKSKPEFLNSKEYTCPFCYAADRDRLCVAFLRKVFGKFSKEKVTLLDIAPATPIEEYLKNNCSFVDVKTADMYMDNVDYKMDIQDMKEIEDKSYDMWICFHVLEHVADDRRALKELYRILKDDGIGLLLVPIDLKSKEIDEDLECSEEERWRRFGQGDHVRRYSKKGFIERVQESGFRVAEINKRNMGREIFIENALPKTAVLYVVSKGRNKFIDTIA